MSPILTYSAEYKSRWTAHIFLIEYHPQLLSSPSGSHTMHATGLLSVFVALLGVASASPASPERLERRVTHTGTTTYYFQEGAAGACGIVHKDTDHVVALLRYRQLTPAALQPSTALGVVGRVSPHRLSSSSRGSGVKPELHPYTRGTGLFGVAWDKLLPLLFAFCFYISVCMGPKGYFLRQRSRVFPALAPPQTPKESNTTQNPQLTFEERVILCCCPWGRFTRCFITLFPTDTVGRIYAELRRIHVIPCYDTSIEPMVYYDAFQSSPLKCETTMQQLGIEELPVLHVRYQLLGETGGSIWDVLGSQAQRARNSNSAGPSAPAIPSHFPSIHLNRWIPTSSKPGQWWCLVCNNGKHTYPTSYITHHEKMDTHKIKLVDRVQEILGALLNGLQAVSTDQQGSSTGGWEVEDTSHIDWEGQGMDYDAVMGRSQDEQRLDEIKAQLKEYVLDDGAFEMDEDVEDVERDDIIYEFDTLISNYFFQISWLIDHIPLYSSLATSHRPRRVDPFCSKHHDAHVKVSFALGNYHKSLMRITARKLLVDPKRTKFDIAAEALKHLEDNAVLHHIDYIYKNPVFREIFVTEVRTKCSESCTALRKIGEESLVKAPISLTAFTESVAEKFMEGALGEAVGPAYTLRWSLFIRSNRRYIYETREILDPVKRKALSLPAKDTDTKGENFFQGYAQWLRWIVYDEDPPPKSVAYQGNANSQNKPLRQTL
ncbi:hypothetical protein M422DRAFT_255592 [Sphaerobolus stellatus SS14]|uniref:Unplaced genomic scaffold SPHSTscaffold_62, whole genome shotgun sequence n=1 Tax=Sphaerobolus stellatus (strain SS14) TaxID=990650 RepID=A0A0C9VSK3_SPHS4|nr:hypothetical protein M422DRAFT_255592 [Sphaerobolus stellatus SS14]